LEIADYIGTDNPARAFTFVEELEERCAVLGKSPLAARRLPQLGDDAHILPYQNYVIIYRDLPAEVSITRIIHGARDIIALIAPDD
jgi:toxin ParE1/3/4